MKKSKRLFIDFQNRMGLNKKSEKVWFSITFLLLLAYLEVVVFFQNYLFGDFNVVTALLCMIAVVPACFIGVELCNRISIDPYERIESRINQKKKALIIASVVFVLTLVIYLINFFPFRPGMFGPDAQNQLNQVITGEYSNWHPVLHTWLFFALPYKITHSMTCIVVFQIILFSLSVSYLFYVLYKCGCHKFLMVASYLFIALNPNTLKMLFLPAKDTAMSIFALVVFTQLIEIYLSEGAWLKKWRNILSFSLFSFLTICMRHNAILMIFPIFVFLLIFLKKVRKDVAISAVSVVVSLVIFAGPICSLANVSKPGNRTTETVGLPMTILSYVYMNDRDALSDECREFMDSLATQEEWNENFKEAFNSIKFHGEGASEKVESEGMTNILRYTVETVKASPAVSLKSALLLTKMVWCFEVDDVWDNILISVGDGEIPVNEDALSQRMLASCRTYYDLCNRYITRYLFDFFGVIILAAMFAAVGKIGRGNLGRVFMVLSPLAYDFGTMLLLSGGDFRFFHFNFLIIVPLLYLFFVKKKEIYDEKDIGLSKEPSV